MSESYPVCCRTCKHYHEHDHQCRLNPKWYNVYQIDEHYCNYHELRPKPEGFEVGKCYKSVDNIYFKPDKIIDELAIGEGLFEDKHSNEKRIDINYRQFWQEITEEEYEEAVAPHRPKPFSVEPGHAYQSDIGKSIYVVEVVGETAYGDVFIDEDIQRDRYFPFVGKAKPKIDKYHLFSEIQLSEWFERTLEYNPGWQVGGYYKSKKGTFAHIIHEKHGEKYPAISISSSGNLLVPCWFNEEFFEFEFLPITKAQWDARLAEVSA